MSLVVYLSKGEVPKGMHYIEENDAYFNGFTTLSGTDFEKKVLKEIDKAEIVNEYSVIFIQHREFGAFNIENLCTGTKTLLNVYRHPDRCFNVLECGDNALEFLCDIKEGHIVWEYPFINLLRDDETCDIECRGKHFTNIVEFLDYDWED